MPKADMAGIHTEGRPGPARSEFAVLVSQYGRAQSRCSRLIAEQAALIETLQAEQMRLRAALIIRVTTLQFERAERARLEALAPGLPRRAALVRQIEQLRARLESLLRERTHWLRGLGRPQRVEGGGLEGSAPGAGTITSSAGVPPGGSATRIAEIESGPLCGDEATGQSLQEVELLICRTGCISHGDYWRAQDHCRRTGKPCILIDEHRAIHVARQGDGVVVLPCPIRSLEA